VVPSDFGGKSVECRDVMRILEEEVMRDAPPGRPGVWDTRVRDLCSQVLSVAEREIMVRKWKGRIGGPSMDADFEKWHLVMQSKWRKMADRRGQTRGEEHQGQRTSRLPGMTEEIERKRKEADEASKLVAPQSGQYCTN